MKQNISSQQPGSVDQHLIRWLVAWLRRREWNMSEAEVRDTVGRVLMKFVEDPPEGILSLRAYFCWRIRNEVKERYRQSRERPRLEEWPIDAESMHRAPETDYETEYTLSRIVNALPARQREVLLLNQVCGIALADIAKGMNVSYSTVHRLLKRAIARCHALAGRTHGEPK